jgi:hypothetical protein
MYRSDPSERGSSAALVALLVVQLCIAHPWLVSGRDMSCAAPGWHRILRLPARIGLQLALLVFALRQVPISNSRRTSFSDMRSWDSSRQPTISGVGRP